MAKAKKQVVEQVEESEDEGSEYEVDQIKKHRRTKAAGLEYFVSWVGYPNEDDDCWITEDSAEGAPDAISAYWESVPVAKRSARYASGVVPDSASTKKSAKSTASTSTPKVDTPVTSGTKRSAAKAADEKEESARSKKKATNGGSSAAKARKSSPALGSAKKKSKAATPAVAEPSKTEEMEVDDNPLGGPANGEEDVDGRKFFAHHLEKDYIKNKSWESLIKKIETIEKDEEDEEALKFFVVWKDDTYSWVKSAELRKRSPQKVIDFYEGHLKFSVKVDEDEEEVEETA